MEILYSDPHREVRAIRVERASDVDGLPAAPFAVLLWSCAPSHAVDDATGLLERLFDSGCRYVVAGGIDCEWWHDLADEVFLARYPTDAEREANFVMTTWHTDETEQEVVWFFLMNTRSFGDHQPYERFLLLEISPDDGSGHRLRESIAKFAGR